MNGGLGISHISKGSRKKSNVLCFQRVVK
jgi:hypothetical protein